MAKTARGFLWFLSALAWVSCSTPPATESPVEDVADTAQVDTSDAVDIAKDVTKVETCPGGGGCACSADSECGSGHCLTDETGAKACARSCDGALCPAGFGCGTLDNKALCIPKRVNLCEPCLKDDNECAIAGLSGAACVKYGNLGAFCGFACTGDADCGAGYACRAMQRVEGGQTQQCVKVDGQGDVAECTCSQRAIDAGKSTICGVSGGANTCHGTRVCGAGGLSACSAQAPAKEVCDGIDNDCNGATDEGQCYDANPCTDDVCGGASGCSNPANTQPCTDGNACTIDDACKDGACSGATNACDDGNPCTQDSCATTTGCSHKAAAGACEDGDPCTTGDKCAGGVCLPGAVTNCDDGVACTADACGDTGCSHTPATGGICDDGDKCTGNDSCAVGLCAGATVDCDDGNPCTADTCAKATGCQHNDATGACDDANPCTTGDTCSGGTCVGSITDCPSLGSCLVASCSPTAGGCAYALKANGTACNDGDACTTGDACVAGDCAGTAANCNDNNPCTDDSCSATTGCGHVPTTGACDDGNSCTQNDSCATGSCVGTAINCDDGKPCTDDLCGPSGCSHTNRTGVCDDGKPCTANDTCTAGTCAGTGNTDCNDADPCTDDSCDAVNGCQHAPNSTGSCDADANACTTDKCASGVCTAGAAKTCNDANSCTTDSCDATTGNCVFTPISDGTACDDGNACNSPDSCQAGVCTGSIPGPTVSTYAGQGIAGKTEDANPLVATFSGPRSLTFDGAGNLFIADTANFKVRKVGANGGAVSTWAGQGITGYLEGVGTAARFGRVHAVIAAGTDVYVSDPDMQNIRKIDAAQQTSLVAGLAIEPSFPATTNAGDFADGPGASALFNGPTGLAIDAGSNTLYVADQGNNRIRAIDLGTGTVSTLAGTGATGQGDGALASATFNQPTGLWLTADGTQLYVTDIGSNTVRLIDLTNSLVSTIAGIGSAGNADGANMTVASFSSPYGITGDGTTLWLADRGNNRIRAISATTTSTLTGSASGTFANGTFSQATFNQPSGIVWVSTGLWYVADTKNNRIRKLLDPTAGCVP